MPPRKSLALIGENNPVMSIMRSSILWGTGMATDQLASKPLIAIANSHTELTTGHSHLATLAQKVKDGVHAAGGIAVEFNVPAPCDGLAMGHDGMRHVLAQRDLIADIVECYVRSQCFDGVVMIAGCDKINPGMMMAAARLDLPAIYLSGGPGMWDIRNRSDREESVDHKSYRDLPRKTATTTCASCGACEVMGTANTFQCLAEAMGLCLPGSSNVPGFHPNKLRYARATGERIVRMIEEGLNVRRVLTREALLDALVIDLAIGGSTNAALHLPAIANALDEAFPLSLFNDYASRIPTLLAISPSGPYGVIDLFRAGGTPAVMKRMQHELHRQRITVSGQTIGEICDAAQIADPEVIPPLDAPHRAQGGTVVLYGNLAPDGAVVKQSAVAPSMMRHSGRAVVTNSEQEAHDALRQGRVRQGDVIVIRYEGPKGGPGMPEMLSLTMALEMMGLHETALVTDGRFSGATAGPCVGHVSPEAYVGGPLAAVETGDVITIDIPNRRIDVRLDAQAIAARLARVERIEKPATGYMRRYRWHVRSAAEGAVLD